MGRCSRSGSFVFQHSGTMSTGELSGLSGSFTLRIDAGRHFYEFTYTLPAP